jgi:hypothetical protein
MEFKQNENERILEELKEISKKLDIITYILENIMIQDRKFDEQSLKKYVSYKLARSNDIDYLVSSPNNLIDVITEE